MKFEIACCELLRIIGIRDGRAGGLQSPRFGQLIFSGKIRAGTFSKTKYKKNYNLNMFQNL